MTEDEAAIRNLVALWHTETASGDVDAVLTLMAEDVVFLTPQQPPMRGREAFARALRHLLIEHRIESSGEVEEIVISGNLAYCWTHLSVKVMSSKGDKGVLRTGSALSVLRKQPNGVWVVVRDANLLAPV